MTNNKVIKKWNNNEILNSVSMGGLGPAYELIIQKNIFDIFSYLIENKIKKSELVNKKTNEYKKKYDNICNDIFHDRGMSGAQADVAKSVAYQFFAYGYQYMMDKVPENRIIMVSKNDINILQR